MLESLRTTADALGRADLAAAAAWLQAHRPDAEPVVVCHGDMHPFNLLVDDRGATTVLDWSAAMLAPGTYDLGFTSLVVASPPLVVPRALRPVIAAAGRALSRRFVRAYERAAGRPVDRASLAWHQGVVCVRALVEVAGWVAAGTIEGRDGHPVGDRRRCVRGATPRPDRRRGHASLSVDPTGWVSYMRTSTTMPDKAVRPATAQMAAVIENESARTPARSAPTAKPPSRQSR